MAQHNPSSLLRRFAIAGGLALFALAWALDGSAITAPDSRKQKPTPAPGVGMTYQGLEAVIRRMASDVEGSGNALQFHFKEVAIACIWDTRYDRMRLIAPIIETKDMTPAQALEMLEANYHSALDARYATSDGVVFAAFIHPLTPLTEAQLESAVSQVSNLARSFGSTYSSGVLNYGEQGATM